MATLLQVDEGRQVTLLARHLVGRAPRCDLQLPSRRVSGDHALLRWNGSVWVIRDLGSRNGTYVNGRRLSTGVDQPLAAGDTLRFSDQDGWKLQSAEAPLARAIADGGEAEVVAEAGMLALPSVDDPQVCVVHDGERWVMERGDGGIVEEVHDGMRLEAGGVRWVLSLPQTLDRTLDGQGRPTLDNVGLRFAVSQDEEHVELWLERGDEELSLGARAHHYTLLTLARRRLEDAALHGPEQGWVYQDELLDMLRIDANILHQHLYRARRQLAGAGVADAGGIVQRRRGTGQLRIGVKRISVGPLEGR
ncbi:MAG: FHA domain-containing protein [Alphaproteobacteria bacterium]|nr:FHA domain-containing protein [Alphaproteobacteria bacterium]